MIFEGILNFLITDSASRSPEISIISHLQRASCLPRIGNKNILPIVVQYRNLTLINLFPDVISYRLITSRVL